MLSLLPLLCALPSTLALPLLAERIVPSLSCSPILPSYLASGNLFVRSSAVDGQLVPLGIDAGKNLTWSTTGKEAAGSVEGSFGFEVCNSTFMKTCVSALPRLPSCLSFLNPLRKADATSPCLSLVCV